MTCTCNLNGSSFNLCDYCWGFTNGYTLERIAYSRQIVKQPIGMMFKDALPSDNHSNEYNTGYDAGQEKLWKQQFSSQQANTGKPFYSLTDVEFGEMYHAGAALIFEKDKAIDVSCTNARQLLFLSNLLEANQLIFNQGKPKEQGSRAWYEQLKNEQKNKYKNTQAIAYENATKIVSSQFKQNSTEAQKIILDNFIRPLTDSISNLEAKFIAYLQKHLNIQNGKALETEKAIIFIRRPLDKKLEGSAPWRNLSKSMLSQILTSVKESQIKEFILVGDKLDNNEEEKLKKEHNTIKLHNMIDFFKHPDFQKIVGVNLVAGQIYFYHILHTQFNVKFMTGMMSGALDGPAFIGMPTVFFMPKGWARMKKASDDISFLIPIDYDEERVKLQYQKNAIEAQFSQGELSVFKQKIDSFSDQEKPTLQQPVTGKQTQKAAKSTQL